MNGSFFRHDTGTRFLDMTQVKTLQQQFPCGLL